MSREEYFNRLGKFVHAFAQCEASLNFAFHKFAKLRPDIAGILKNEASASSVSKMTKAVMRANDFPAAICQEVDHVLAQFSTVSEFRHSVLHRGAMPHESKPDTYVANNAATARGAEGFEITEFSLADLWAATQDLRAISLRLLAASDPVTHKMKPEAIPLAQEPWRYKPVRPHSPYRNTTPKIPKAERKKPRPQGK